ncbi:Transposable element P transposase [Frankliniella fusca]|uniref:Transposable element P transposase n=1 Tax=Frankliniella fusca TaxID=407009 RepID=A0AAE1HTB0_9NEOP|nr:Transposable element P transposase [Frankliniella fusca]
MWGTHTSPGTVLAYTRMNNTFDIDVKIILHNSLEPKIFVHDQLVPFALPILDKKGVETLLERLLTVKYKTQVQSLKKLVEKSRAKCAELPKKQREHLISTVPQEQQELLRNVFNCSKTSLKGRRYTIEWIYECFLMKIKSPTLYRKLRRENKLPLPSPRTLRRYIQKLRPQWGFQENTFSLLKEKAPLISVADRHGKIIKNNAGNSTGTLLLDEMALTERVNFEGDSLQVHGLVNLGKYTPEADKTKRGDHALVLMFQPFRGLWVQAIGAFLSAGAVRGPVLQKIVLEALILLENAGYYVDCVTTDAATWNRSMWNLFGLSKNVNSCEHPVDPTRRLYFASDFPHLMKRLWTRVVNNKVLEAVVRLEEGKGIRSAFPLTKDHLCPTTYQRMNVRMAMQFFSHTVGTAMEDYKLRGEKDLEDGQPTINFILRINKVVEAMNSKKPVEALRADEDSVHQKVLTDFLSYLKIMDDMAQSKARMIKENTYLGFVVTVRTALDLIKYLHENFNYQYFMTRRLNQDALEHFFGQLRYACGSSDHPDPKLFKEVYRLLTTYSLVKPPRGSNVTGGDLLGSLLKLKDIVGGVPFEEYEIINTDIQAFEREIDQHSLTYFGGYICRKARKMEPAASCPDCFKSLHAPPERESLQREQLVDLRHYGGLLKPSDVLFDLIMQVEEAVVKTTSGTQMHSMLLFDMLEQLSGLALQKIGCEQHQKPLTASVITFSQSLRRH